MEIYKRFEMSLQLEQWLKSTSKNQSVTHANRMKMAPPQNTPFAIRKFDQPNVIKSTPFAMRNGSVIPEESEFEDDISMAGTIFSENGFMTHNEKINDDRMLPQPIQTIDLTVQNNNAGNFFTSS